MLELTTSVDQIEPFLTPRAQKVPLTNEPLLRKFPYFQ